MKKMAMISVSFIILLSIATGQGITGRQMHLVVNGNDYRMYDFINDTIVSYYRENSESFKQQMLDLIQENIGAVTDGQGRLFCVLGWPSEVSAINYYFSAPSTIWINIVLNGIKIHWNHYCCGQTCRFEMEGGITIGMSAEIVQEGTMICLQSTPQLFGHSLSLIGKSAWPNDWEGDIECAARAFLYNLALCFAPLYLEFDTYTIPLADLSGFKLPNGIPLADPLLTELMDALPFNVTPGVHADGNLQLSMDILSEYAGINPPVVSNPRYDYVGFACPYYAFQGAKLLPGVSTTTEQQQILIDTMAFYGANAFRFSIPWKEVFPTVDPSNTQSPDVLTGSTLDAAIAAIPSSVWSNTDMVVNRAFVRGLDVVPQFPQQEKDLPTINGATIAPDPVKRGLDIDGYYYVHPNTYMYYLKIFANAAVRRYKNKVAVWALESELNCSRIAAEVQWRHGDCWTDISPGGFVDQYWDILVDAVRSNDPTAKIASNFHVLNLREGIDRFGPDLDIIGVDVYPNIIVTAYPVMSYMVGEFVRATRRALYGKGWTDKEVHVMETSYPGMDPDMSSSDGSSIYECINKYSYYRQNEFMRGALTSALNFGATGFFWWGFLDDEYNTSPPEGPQGNFGSLIRLETSSYSIKPAAWTFKAEMPNIHRLDFSTGMTPTMVDIGDLNNDGKQDLVVVNEYVNSISVMKNITAVGASIPSYARFDIATGSYPIDVEIADLNFDGKQDIVVLNRNAKTVSLFANTTSTVGADPTFSKTDLSIHKSFYNPSSVAIGDLDNNGKQDIVALNDCGISVFMNYTYDYPYNNDLRFLDDQVIFTGISSYYSDLSMADMNNDGKVDVVLTNGGDCIFVLINKTQTQYWAEFEEPTAIPTTDASCYLTVSDFNADGKLDIAAAIYNPGSIAVHFNTTIPNTFPPTFAPKIDINNVYHAYCITSGDLTGDGKPDLVITNRPNNNVTVFENKTSAGSFTPEFPCKSVLTTGLNPYGIEIEDLNGNGTKDIAVVNCYSNTVSVFLDLYEQECAGAITHNTIWDGNIVVEDNITIASGATLLINPGTNIYIKSNKKIIVSAGAKIIANGSEGSYIRFVRYDDNNWNNIVLEGCDNQFSWCLFDGGHFNVEVKSIGNTFSCCTFRNAARGIGSNYWYSGGTNHSSNFSLNNCLIENNLCGVAALHSGGISINQTTIRNNAGIGLSVYNSCITHFTNNVIENNDDYGIWMGPISVLYMGVATTIYNSGNNVDEIPEGATGAGRNRIKNNCLTRAVEPYEIYVFTTGQITLGHLIEGPWLRGGYNKISPSQKFIYNSAMTESHETLVEWTVPASMTRWGEDGIIDPGKFYGPVNYSYPLHFDPTENSGIGEGTVPLLKISGTKNYSKPSTVLTAAVADKLSESQGEASRQQFIVNLKTKIIQIKAKLNDEQNCQYRGRLLGELSTLALLDPDDKTGESQSINSLLRVYRERLTSNTKMDAVERLISEAALVNEIVNGLKRGEISQVQELLGKYSSCIQNNDNKLALYFAEMVAYEQLGEYTKAWDALKAAKAIGPDEQRKRWYVAPSYATIETTLREKAEEAGIVLAVEDNKTAGQQLPKQIALLQNYPNPFNPMTTIKYELPATARVTLKVYDMLGREVAVLQDGIKEAGYWTATFDASKLSSGVYFSRLVVQSSNGEMVTQVKKMLLVK